MAVPVLAQNTLREFSWPASQDSLCFDGILVLPQTLTVLDTAGLNVRNWEWTSDYTCLIRTVAANSPWKVRVRTTSMSLSGPYFLRDTSENNQVMRDLASYRPTPQSGFQLPGSNLRKTGSLSRGVAFGNNQNLSVNSNLNLQLSGNITDNLQILASISDNTVPIQPQGNTQQLQDFDQVYIQLFDDRNKLVAGDFQIIQNTDPYMRFNKRAQGLSYSGTSAPADSLGEWRVSASAALSKGKFARNEIQGVEGNQGPYRLTGGNGEQFILAIAGTERVFIDGRLLTRGQDADYVIDYNLAEITFTPREPITKDRRIIVEFQYGDRNYARSMLQGEARITDRNKTGYLRWFSETDSRNQPLQQELTLADREVLTAAGDDPLAAVIQGVDSVGWSPDAVRYALRDSLGFNEVLVFSTNSDSALYTAVFSEVGQGNGDYVEDGFVASGRVFRWIAPAEIDGQLVPQGNYAPLQVLARPEQRRMASAGGEIGLGKRWTAFANAAWSQLDRNTFSALDRGDDDGYALRGGFRFDRTWDVPGRFQQKDTTDGTSADAFAMERRFTGDISGEWISTYFNPIERFRSVEFQRDWNILGENLVGDQRLVQTDWQYTSGKQFRLEAGAAAFSYGAYTGLRGRGALHWKNNRSLLDYRASILQTADLENTLFARHKTHAYRNLGRIRLGYRDEWEWNERRLNDSLLTTAYRFHDVEVYLALADSSRVGLKAYYRIRDDRLSDSLQFVLANRAEQVGVKLDLVRNPKHQVRVNVSNRMLRIVDEEVSRSQPESTLIGRLEHRWAPGNGAFRSDVFYETGSGLEQKREFVYIEVPPGQGVYVWNDYNGDGIKDLGEFEVAAFAYEANYIRSFIQGTEYIRTFSTTFTGNVNLQPSRSKALSDSKFKWLSRFSALGSVRLDRKTLEEPGLQRFDPTISSIADSSLVRLESSIRGTVFFNRTHPVYGLQGSAREVQSKTLLANGFDSRYRREWEGLLRLVLAKAWTVRTTAVQFTDEALADYTAGRNYAIRGFTVKPELTWQPNTRYRLVMDFRYTERNNSDDLGGERAEILELGISGKLGSLEKGSIEARVALLNIGYTGAGQGALTFAMLEGLTAGRNATWGLDLRRNVVKNLQLTVRYDGRTGALGNTIHSGGLQVRAFF